MKSSYWTFKNGIQSDKIKQEQVKGKSPFIIWNYLDLFKKYNIPMIYKEWYYILQRQYKKNKTYQEMQRIVFGKYLALMKLKGYKDFSFKDSKHFNNYYEE